MTTAEAAEYLHRSIRHVRTLITTGVLKAEMGADGKWLVDARAVKKLKLPGDHSVAGTPEAFAWASKAGKARAKALTPEQMSEIGRRGGKASIASQAAKGWPGRRKARDLKK